MSLCDDGRQKAELQRQRVLDLEKLAWQTDQTASSCLFALGDRSGLWSDIQTASHPEWKRSDGLQVKVFQTFVWCSALCQTFLCSDRTCRANQSPPEAFWSGTHGNPTRSIHKCDPLWWSKHAIKQKLLTANIALVKQDVETGNRLLIRYKMLIYRRCDYSSLHCPQVAKNINVMQVRHKLQELL